MSWFDKLFGIEDSEDKRDDYLEDRQGTADTYLDQAGKFDKMSGQFFDPQSSLNTNRFGLLESTIQDNTARGIQEWQSEMARTGNNVSSSGVGAQNILQARRRAGGDSADALNKAYQSSFGLGMNAAQMGMKNRQLGDNIYAGANQVKMQQDSINAQKRAGAYQMIGGAAMNMIAPGLGSLMGGAMSNMAEGDGFMAQFAKPYAQNYENQQAIQDSFSGLLKYTTPGYTKQSPSNPASYIDDDLYTGDMAAYSNFGKRRRRFGE